MCLRLKWTNYLLRFLQTNVLANECAPGFCNCIYPYSFVCTHYLTFDVCSKKQTISIIIVEFLTLFRIVCFSKFSLGARARGEIELIVCLFVLCENRKFCNYTLYFYVLLLSLTAFLYKISNVLNIFVSSVMHYEFFFSLNLYWHSITKNDQFICYIFCCLHFSWRIEYESKISKKHKIRWSRFFASLLLFD